MDLQSGIGASSGHPSIPRVSGKAVLPSKLPSPSLSIETRHDGISTSITEPSEDIGPTFRIPYLSNAWGLLDQLVVERGLALTDDEHSRIIVQASMAGMKEDREPVLKDVLAALADVLGRE